MTDHAGRADYLEGETDGANLGREERARLDRIRNQLDGPAVWEAPAADGMSRLLAAAAAEQQRAPVEVITPGIQQAKGRVEQTTDVRAAVGENQPISLDAHRQRRSGRTWFGAGVLTAAAVAAIALIGANQLRSSDDGAVELEVAATFQLDPTELDPDVVAELDVLPTPAGVQLELRLMGLDNAVGQDYYAAWLLSDDADAEAIPLGSFHWRAGGVPIILWSGVDDPAFSRFIVTRQTQGDLGLRSDAVVLTGEVTDLVGDGS